MDRLTIIAALASAAVAEPPARWFPPASDSHCWVWYEGCVIDAYAERGEVTQSELLRRLEECKQGLTACALYEWLREKLGDDVASAYLEAVDPAAAEALADLVGSW